MIIEKDFKESELSHMRDDMEELLEQQSDKVFKLNVCKTVLGWYELIPGKIKDLATHIDKAIGVNDCTKLLRDGKNDLEHILTEDIKYELIKVKLTYSEKDKIKYPTKVEVTGYLKNGKWMYKL